MNYDKNICKIKIKNPSIYLPSPFFSAKTKKEIAIQKNTGKNESF